MEDDPLGNLDTNHVSDEGDQNDEENAGDGTDPVLPGGSHALEEATHWPAAGAETSKREWFQCASCMENKPFDQAACAPCDHEYCQGCLQDLFRACLTDESLYPPRCCRQPIILAAVRFFLNPELFHAYEQKKIEYDTPNRTYCFVPTCSTFIQSENIAGDCGKCSDCGTITCTICKAAEHNGDCPADPSTHAVLELAASEGWQMCLHCRRLIQLDTGCYHIT